MSSVRRALDAPDWSMSKATASTKGPGDKPGPVFHPSLWEILAARIRRYVAGTVLVVDSEFPWLSITVNIT
jgi:hypothetical protein